MLDLVFALRGRVVALDYADRLWRALDAVLPWLAGEPEAGVHPLAGVSAGDTELYLTRRARLSLRLPARRQADTAALSGARLEIGGELEVGAVSVRRLAPVKVLYSPFVTVGRAVEQDFMLACREQLALAGIDAHLVCGKARRARAGDGEIQGFSLMLHGLGAEDSLRLQHQGLGSERKRGCGIFVPHKSVAAVGD